MAMDKKQDHSSCSWSSSSPAQGDTRNILLKLPNLLPQHFPTFTKLLQTALLTITGYVTFRYLSSIIYRRFKCYPHGPLGLPLIGNGSKVLSHKFLMNSCGAFGSLTYCKLFNKNIIFINDSNTLKRIIFNKKIFNDRYPNLTNPNNPMAKLLSTGNVNDISFLSMSGRQNEWKTRRQYAMVSLVRFCDSKFMSDLLYNVMNKVIFDKLDKICNENNGQWEPKDIMYYIAFNTVFHSNFGYGLESGDPTPVELMDVIKILSQTLNSLQVPSNSESSIIWYLYKYIIAPKTVKMFEDGIAERTRIYKSIMEKRREYFQQHPDHLERAVKNDDNKYQLCYVDYLLYLLDYKQSGNKDNQTKSRQSEMTELNERKVINDLALMFFAGTDTTASTLRFSMYLLAKNTEIQEIIYNELKKILGVEEEMHVRQVLQLSDLTKCPEYIACVHELLRISCTLPFGLPHQVKKDTEIVINGKRVTLPANSMLMTNTGYIQRSESSKENWKNKEYGLEMNEICLNNWLVKDSNGIKKFKMNESFVAFGYGIRDCPGQQLALKEIKLVIAYIILNYRLKIDAKVCGEPKKFNINRKFGVVDAVSNDKGIIVEKR